MLAGVLSYVWLSHPGGVRIVGIVTAGFVSGAPGTSFLRAAGGVTRSGSDGFC